MIWVLLIVMVIGFYRIELVLIEQDHQISELRERMSALYNAFDEEKEL